MFKDRVTAKYLLLVYVYTLASMLVWRLFVIPNFVPSTNGEIVGDYLTYATLAIKKGEELLKFGLSHFELRPEGQGPAGLASLLYWLTGSIHYVVIVNSLLHVVAVWSLIRLLRIWFSERVATLASIPFALSVCMMYCFAETNKESYAVSGTLLFTSQYILFFLNSTKSHMTHLKEVLGSMVLIIVGIFLMWIVRPYLIQIFYLGVFVLTPTYLLFFYRTINKKIYFVTANLIVFVCLYSFYKISTFSPSASTNTISAMEDSSINFKSLGYTSADNHVNRCLNFLQEDTWKGGLLPDSIDRKLKVLAVQRCLNFSVLAPAPNKTVLFSTVDSDVYIGSQLDILKYIPRAFQIGVLAPWPSQWATMLTEPLSIPYRVTALEAIFVYVCFLALIWALYKKRLQGNIFVPIYFSFLFMILTGFTCSFLIVTYRYRYVWWMLLASLGLACIIDAIVERKNKSKK